MQLDHVIIAVADLEAAADTYERILGRSTAVRSDHPAHGTCNALFLFDDGPYLELLALRPAAPESDLAGELRGFLAERGEGLFGLALISPNLDATVARLRSLEVDVPEPAYGTAVDAWGRVREWQGTRIPSNLMHGAVTMLVKHEGWDWRIELKMPPVSGRRSSAATGIHHIVVDGPDAHAMSALWEDVLGLPQSEQIESERMGALVNVHPAGRATIEAVSATTADGPVAERIRLRGHGLSSIAFTVDDIAAAVRALRNGGVTVSDPAPGVLPGSLVARIDPAAAHGVAAQMLAFG